jgi:hypothetical protein
LACLELKILLPQPPECLDYRHAPPQPTGNTFLGYFVSASSFLIWKTLMWPVIFVGLIIIGTFFSWKLYGKIVRKRKDKTGHIGKSWNIRCLCEWGISFWRVIL